MPTKRYSTEQIVSKLRQAEVELSRGLHIPQMYKKLGISEQTYYESDDWAGQANVVPHRPVEKLWIEIGAGQLRFVQQRLYETARARGAMVVVPPARTANVSGHGPRSPARDRTIHLVKTLGQRRWKRASGYHRQGRVENAFFRYKSIIGDGLRARSPAGQGSKVVLGCEILQSDDRPRPTSVVSQRQVRTLSIGHRAGQSRLVQQRPKTTQRTSTSEALLL